VRTAAGQPTFANSPYRSSWVAEKSLPTPGFAHNGGVSNDYQLVQLRGGAATLYSASYGEKMHPGLGPQAEADLLYVRQLQLCERLRASGELTVWDIGLGGAANAIAVLRAAREIPGCLRLVSFDNTAEPLEFARDHAAELVYPTGYEAPLTTLLQERRVRFTLGELQVDWEFHLADFPALVAGDTPLPAPQAILYDAFSPAKNPAMWTLPVFTHLFRRLDPNQPCALTTYSRSTLLRTTLLLAGFYVGVGHATGLKEETTIAANSLALIPEPLNARWLERADRSDSAEPLTGPVYRRAPLTTETRTQLRSHPQFAGG